MLHVLVIVLIIFVICLVNFFFTQSESDNEYLGLFPSSRLQRDKNTLKESLKEGSKFHQYIQNKFHTTSFACFFLCLSLSLDLGDGGEGRRVLIICLLQAVVWRKDLLVNPRCL